MYYKSLVALKDDEGRYFLQSATACRFTRCSMAQRAKEVASVTETMVGWLDQWNRLSCGDFVHCEG